MEEKIGVSGSVTTAVLNTKIGKVENKLPDTSGLVNKTDYNAKYQIFRRNTSDNNKFTCDILDAKIKEKNS